MPGPVLVVLIEVEAPASACHARNHQFASVKDDGPPA